MAMNRGLPLRRAWCGWLATLLMAALFVGQAQARRVVAYGGDRAFAPFESLDADGRPQGFQIELLREMSRIGAIDFDIRLGDWRDTEAAFRDGRVDLVAMTETGRRRAWALFARPHATPATGIYLRRGDRPPVALGDLAGHIIAMVEDSEPMRHTRETVMAGGGYRFLLVPTLHDAFEAVRARRADYVMAARAYGDAVLAAGTVDGLVAGEFSLRLQSYGFAVAPGNEALRQELNVLLDRLESGGTLEELRRKWLESHRDVAIRSGLERSLRREQIVLACVVSGGLAATAWLLLRLRRSRARLSEARRRHHDSESRLATVQDKLDRAFTHHPDAMLLTENGMVADFNAAFARMFGWTREDRIGRALDTLPHVAGSEFLAASRALLERHGHFDNLPIVVAGADGSRRYYLTSGARIENGALPQTLAIVREVSAAMEADADLRREFEALIAVERERAGELERARAEARRREEELQTFTEAVAHDLRGPLRAIGGFSGLMRESLGEGDIAAAIASAERIERAARRMDALLADLGRLARAGRASLERGEVDMTAMARRAWEDVAAEDPARRIDCRIDPLPPARADASLIEQVWRNLLHNAWKYSAHATAPQVAIDCHLENGLAWYRITDNGAGFDMAHADQLFEPFRRLHADSEFPGTGLGLAIVQRMVRAHGGAVRARGTPGVGAVIEFTLAVADRD